MEPLRIFGIPVTSPGYYMNCVLTNAQIELIAADVSVVDYDYGKDDKKKRMKGDFDNTKADAGAVRRAAEKWTERHGDGENAGWVNIKDILGDGMKTETGFKIE